MRRSSRSLTHYFAALGLSSLYRSAGCERDGGQIEARLAMCKWLLVLIGPYRASPVAWS